MIIDNWYQMSVEVIAKALHTSTENGLSRKRVRKLLSKHGKNTIYPVSKITFYNCLKSMTLDYTSYLLVVTALIAALFDKNIGAWTILGLVLCNLIITVLAYAKSQRMLEGMDRYTLPVARVVREGRLFGVDQKLLVPGDILILEKGDIVPADARLITAEDLFTDEAHLFDGATYVMKTAGVDLQDTLPYDKQRNMVFASSYIMSGTARAVVCATGEDTAICLLHKNHPVISHENLPLLSLIQKFGRRLSLIVIASVFVLTLLDYLMPWEQTLFSSFIKSMSFAVSTMSEMFVAFGYIVLACAVFQSVQSLKSTNAGAVIKNPLAIDKLKKLSCIVMPKEGILTVRDSVAESIFVGEDLHSIHDRNARRAMERPILYSILSTGKYGADFVKQMSESGRIEQDELVQTAEEAAILRLAKSLEVYNIKLDRSYPLLGHVLRGQNGSPFDTAIVTHRNEAIAICRGEVRMILSRCTYYYDNGKICLMPENLKVKIISTYEKLLHRAYDVFAVSSRVISEANLRLVTNLQKNMVFEGFLAFHAPMQKNAGQLVEQALSAGIKLILLSDSPMDTEAYFARQFHLTEDTERCIDGEKLKALKPEIRNINASYYRVYCGLSNEQKSTLLDDLKENGEIVGFVGNHFSDLELIRKADISFAQNIPVNHDPGNRDTASDKNTSFADTVGSEAMKFESDILVSDATQIGGGGFQSMLETVRIARNTDANIIRIVRYMISSQIARFLLVMYTILLSQNGLTAVQTLFSGLICDLIAVFSFAFQKPDEESLYRHYDMEKELTHPVMRNLSSVIIGISWACNAILASYICTYFGFAQSGLQSSSVLFLFSALAQVLCMFSVQKEGFTLRSGMRLNALQGIFLLCEAELFMLFFLFPGFGSTFGVTKFNILGAAVILLLFGVQFTVTECTKAITFRRQDKDDTDEDTEKQNAIIELFYRLRSEKETITKAAAEEFAFRSRQNAEYKKKISEKETKLSEKKKKITEKAKLKADKKKKEKQKRKQTAKEQAAVFAAETAEAKEASAAQSAQEASETIPVSGSVMEDITVSGDSASIQAFLRNRNGENRAAAQAPAEDGAEEEFSGIGYLFSDGEYDAAMAENNGTQTVSGDRTAKPQ